MQIFVRQLMILQIFPAFRIFIRYRHCANIEFPIFFGVFFEQGSRPRMWASTPWALCRTDRLSTIDYLTGFATAAPQTPERTRTPVAQGSWLSTVRRGHRRTVWRPTVMTPTGCEASPQFTLIDTGRGWVSLLRCAWYWHSGEAVAYTC